MNPGDHWFWDASHPSLKAPQLFQFYLNTVGRGSNWILNVPPDRTGSIPLNFAAEMAKLGAALNASGLGGDGSAIANVSQARVASCAASQVVLTIPHGAVVDALQLREDISSGQTIASYTLELQQQQQQQHRPPPRPSASASVLSTKVAPKWIPITTAGVHGGTIGSQLIDLLDPIYGPAALRWRCTASVPATSARVRLSSMAALKLRPPAGWQRPVTTTWALQTLYSTTDEDMTPCATRSAAGDSSSVSSAPGVNAAAAMAAAENRSSCRAYLDKAGANFSYIRDEHCCLWPPSLATRTTTTTTTTTTVTADAVLPDGTGLVALYLQTSLDDRDHMLSPNKSFSFEGRRYETHGPECYGFPPAATLPTTVGRGVTPPPSPSVPLDVYWSASRQDLWSLASDASRAQAVALGYVLVQKEVARVPISCS